MQPYRRSFPIRWSQLDPNRHLANTAYSALMNDTRMSFFQDHGVDPGFFTRNEIGPVLFSEEFHYLKEIRPGETVQVDLWLQGLSADGRFGRMTHTLTNQDGAPAAFSTLTFGWMDLRTRRLRIPPAEILEALEQLARTDDFRVMTREDTRAAIDLPGVGRRAEAQ